MHSLGIVQWNSTRRNHPGNPGGVSRSGSVTHYGIIAFICTVTSRRVGCGCTVWTFTTLGECGLGLSLGLRPMKTHSSNQEMKSK